jgi:hypothetical protein
MSGLRRGGPSTGIGGLDVRAGGVLTGMSGSANSPGRERDS